MTLLAAAVVELVVVDCNYRRSGYATMLMQSAIDSMVRAGADRITIYVKSFNIPARILYENIFQFKQYTQYPELNVVGLVLYVV